MVAGTGLPLAATKGDKMHLMGGFPLSHDPFGA